MLRTFEQGTEFTSGVSGIAYRCVRRWFEGYLELVELQAGDNAPFIRTARAMSAPVFPQVTEYRGGVTKPDRCDHIRKRTFAYGWICDLCGTPM